MNYWVVVGNGKTNRAIVCEERALAWTREEMAEEFGVNVTAIPAECHWTAEIRFPTEPADVDGIERW